MKVGGPLASQFNFLYQQAMPQNQVKDTCVPTQWFGPMAKASFPQKTTLNTWWNRDQDGKQILNDGVAAFNYQPPPCQHFRKFDRGWGECFFLGAAVILTALGFIYFGFRRSQIKQDLREEAALEVAGALRSVDEKTISSVPVQVPLTITPLPRPASDTFEVDKIRNLAKSQSVSGRELD